MLTASVTSRATAVSTPQECLDSKERERDRAGATSGQPSATILRRSSGLRSRCTWLRAAIQCTYVSAAQ